MFTNNYIAFRYDLFFGVNGSGTGLTFGAKVLYGKNMITALGGEIQFSSMQNISASDLGRCLGGRCTPLLTSYGSSADGANPGIYFGSGTTPATKEDYTLESVIESGLTIDSGAVFVENTANGQYCVSRNYIVKNTTDAAITITEIGCFAPIQSGSSKYYQVLMERTVLSSPITIPPGEAKLVTYKINFNHG